MQDHYDVVVVGGGSAGLSGAVALARSRRSVLVVDAGDPRNAPADGVHNYLGHEGMPPLELLALGRKELAGYGGEVVRGRVSQVEALEGGTPSFRVTIQDGESVHARRLLLATGLRDELPQIEGLAERWGNDVIHCPYCHGYEHRDRAIGVLATSPMVGHQALMFRQLSEDVIVFSNKVELPTDSLAQFAARGIRVVEGEVAAVEADANGLTGVRLASGEVIARQVLVVAPKFQARTDGLKGLGLEAVPQEMNGLVVGSSIEADATGRTPVPGVWAAGNVTSMSAQVMIAAGAGLMAGSQINADLIAEETRLAVETFRAVEEAVEETAETAEGR